MRLGKACGQTQGEAGELAEGALSVMSVEILERKYGLTLNVAAAVRDVLQQRATPEQALDRLLHDTHADTRTPVTRMPRPAPARPITRDPDLQPAEPAWGLSYA
jgi:hypothetical protein